MLSTARKQAEAQVRQISKLKSRLFPNGTLQERVDNIIPYYAKYGSKFIDEVYKASNALQNTFCILNETAHGKDPGN